MVVPDRGRGRVLRLSFEMRRLRRAVSLVGLVAAAAALTLGWLVAELPLIWSHDDLVEENLALRGQLRDIEGQLDQIDASLRRLRLFDAQLREMSDSPLFPGGTGPISDEDALLLGLEPHTHGGDSVYLPWLPIPGPSLTPEDLRPAESWGRAVEARTADMLRVMGQMEPRMSALAEDVEDLLSVRAALPQIWPLAGVFTSGFGYRSSPFKRRWNFHSGIDVSAPRGSRIMAVAPGEVTEAEYTGGYGRMILIDHGYGIVTRYAHNTSLFVKVGDEVASGQVISTVGTTGQATGPHLHFEILIDGRAVDPLDYLPR